MSLSHHFKSFRPTRLFGLAVSGLLILASTSLAMASAGLTTQVDKLYEGPVPGAAVLATIPAGSKVGILWCGMHKEWCLIDFHATEGFVSYLSLELIGGTSAVSDTGPGGTSTHGGPATSTGAPLPPMSLVTGNGVKFVGSPKGAANLVTAIKH